MEAMSRSATKWLVIPVVMVAVCQLAGHAVGAASPSVADALKVKPIQVEVDFDTPDEATFATCVLKTLQDKRMTGYELRDAAGNVLRRFLDTNRDGRVDQWCYFKDGVEVYRDIDSNFNRKADQYRWLGTAGVRWGIDNDEDGRIDRWLAISPEEVSEEIVAALRTRDTARFRCLLLTAEELAALKLGKSQMTQLQEKIAAAASGFENLVRRQKFVSDTTRWVNFGATRPGVVPAGTDESEQDLEVYENASALVETDGTHAQVIVGTMVRTANGWRVIDLPHSLEDAQASSIPSGFFFEASLARRADADVPVTGGLSPELQKLIGELEIIDNDLATASTLDQQATLNAKRADVLEKLANLATNDEERATWLHQLADTVSAAVQSGGYPDGVTRLANLYQRLANDKADQALIAYVRFRHLSAEYGQSAQDPNEDFAKVQDKWVADLERFVAEYGTTPDGAEAMLQLGMAQEFAGKDEEAVKWYAQASAAFPESPLAKKALGAQRRILSVGKSLELAGKDLTGKTVSLSALRGKVVLVHYWATWYAPCRQELSVLKDMQAKYGKENFALVGINVDNLTEARDAYLTENPLPWPQLFEPGGLDSPLALELGVLTMPTMILLDRTGKVVNRNLTAGEVDDELKKLLR